MNISTTHSAGLTAGSITSHVYDDGSAYLELGTGSTARQSILIWAGRDGADLAEETRALRKLAAVATELAAALQDRAGVDKSVTSRPQPNHAP